MKLEEIELFIENYEKPVISHFVGNKLYKSENGKYLGRIIRDDLSYKLGSLILCITISFFEMADGTYLRVHEVFEFNKRWWSTKNYNYTERAILNIETLEKELVTELIGNYLGINKLKKFMNINDVEVI